MTEQSAQGIVHNMLFLHLTKVPNKVQVRVPYLILFFIGIVVAKKISGLSRDVHLP